jgi:flagellin
MSVINTNVKALVSQESMRSNNLKLSTAMERLSTGLRINSAKDDAAGLAISNRMTSQIRGFAMAIKNSNDGVSMAQTADGAYGQVTSMLQRMRELAVQAATGSMSNDDRKSIQLEIDELKLEIDNVANKTNFNGIKLLDGSARDIKLQTGTNEGDLMNIGFDSVKTKDIGSGDRPALTSVGGDAEVMDAFSAGDVIINGVLVGASYATDDVKSFSATTTAVAASAIAKVAAINRVSDESGVVAKVNDTTVIGTSMTAATGTGTITINGVETSKFAVSDDTEISRAAVAQAINNISAQTGVRAINTGDDNQGVILVADDGRNITVELSSATAVATSGTWTSASTGISAGTSGAAKTYVGTYSLYSLNGSPITIGQQVGKDITGTGLQLGTYEADVAQVTSFERSANGTAAAAAARSGQAAGSSPSASAASNTGVGVLNGDTLVINDIAIGAARATDDTASHATTASSKASSAIAIAAAINAKTDLHGVTAKAAANVIRSETTTNFVAGTSGVMNLNGVEIEVNTITRNNVVDSINAHTGRTGVVARAYGEGIELVAEDGRNISIAANVSAQNLGLAGISIGGSEGAAASAISSNAGVTFYASVTLTADKAFTIARGNEGSGTGQIGGGNFERLGFREGTFGGNDTGMKVAELDVTTQLGAGMAITAIDAAINDVASAQARSGAFQNRLEATISVLSESSENTSAARSRILDTDYAQETTALAKAQIIQQAATAMLAQANQQQQSVLALLQ